MSVDLEFWSDVRLTSFQASLIRRATPDIRQSRQFDFHKCIADQLRPIQAVSDRNVRDAIDEAKRRHGKPPQC